ncbi:MAG: hypothetical protein LBG45_03245 [Dysgonamonadaceae bacterium]|nr:hypothetical protein [Dysgonamonadaceae bacterium]
MPNVQRTKIRKPIFLWVSCISISSCDSSGVEKAGYPSQLEANRQHHVLTNDGYHAQNLENRDSLILRKATRPNQEQAKIYRALNFKQTNPKMREKTVVPHK